MIFILRRHKKVGMVRQTTQGNVNKAISNSPSNQPTTDHAEDFREDRDRSDHIEEDDDDDDDNDVQVGTNFSQTPDSLLVVPSPPGGKNVNNNKDISGAGLHFPAIMQQHQPGNRWLTAYAADNDPFPVTPGKIMSKTNSFEDSGPGDADRRKSNSHDGMLSN